MPCLNFHSIYLDSLIKTENCESTVGFNSDLCDIAQKSCRKPAKQKNPKVQQFITKLTSTRCAPTLYSCTVCFKTWLCRLPVLQCCLSWTAEERAPPVTSDVPYVARTPHVKWTDGSCPTPRNIDIFEVMISVEEKSDRILPHVGVS